MPPLAAVANPVSVMPFLGEARTLRFPEISACLLLGWLIVLTLPNVHRMTERGRQRSLIASSRLPCRRCSLRRTWRRSCILSFALPDSELLLRVARAVWFRIRLPAGPSTDARRAERTD